MLTIGITTFKHRFDKYLKPLINSIKTFHPDIEIVVAINGEHNEVFDEYYRSSILDFISKSKNTFPVLFPSFRGLSKLWNTLLIHSSNDYILVLNDDVSIKNENFIPSVLDNIRQLETSFQINNSFSHVVMKKSEIIYDLGGVSEKLLGIGEEEYIMWTYAEQYGKEWANVNINGIENHVDFSHAPTNIKQIVGGSKYSQFNREIMYNILFNIDDKKGIFHGKIPAALVKDSLNHPHQYPNEEFYKEKKNSL